MSNDRTVTEILEEDHREVEQMFEQIKATPTGEPRRDLTNKVIAELIRHSVAEEQYLYPAVRKHVPGGNELADREVKEHSQAESIMKEMEILGPDDEDKVPALFTKLVAAVTQHVHEEETELLPKLEQACERKDLVELGKKIETAKKVAPTRPHPSTPSSPPLNKLLAPGAGMVDRIRDALTGKAN